MTRHLAALAFICLLASPAMAQDCAYDRAAMLTLDVRAFDQTPDNGWRLVGDIEGCETAAADLIAAYRTTHAEALVNGAPSLISGLNWHEAQLRAAAGQTEQAIRLFIFSRFTYSEADALYGQATVAYLQRDREKLQAARDQLAALPEPPGFAEAAARARVEYGLTVTWPSNLDVVEGLIACFERPYREAYSSECRAAAH